MMSSGYSYRDLCKIMGKVPFCCVDKCSNFNIPHICGNCGVTNMHLTEDCSKNKNAAHALTLLKNYVRDAILAFNCSINDKNLYHICNLIIMSSPHQNTNVLPIYTKRSDITDEDEPNVNAKKIKLQ